jgi:cytochrome b involved in lipid metabolism
MVATIDKPRTFTRDEVAKHTSITPPDVWIIIDNGVYDISNWIDKHPGGKVLLYYRGQDATEPVYAFHPDMEKTKKYMKATYIGDLAPDQPPKAIAADFRKLRDEVC